MYTQFKHSAPLTEAEFVPAEMDRGVKVLFPSPVAAVRWGMAKMASHGAVESIAPGQWIAEDGSILTVDVVWQNTTFNKGF